MVKVKVSFFGSRVETVAKVVGATSSGDFLIYLLVIEGPEAFAIGRFSNKPFT